MSSAAGRRDSIRILSTSARPFYIKNFEMRPRLCLRYLVWALAAAAAAGVVESTPVSICIPCLDPSSAEVEAAAGAVGAFNSVNCTPLSGVISSPEGLVPRTPAQAPTSCGFEMSMIRGIESSLSACEQRFRGGEGGTIIGARRTDTRRAESSRKKDTRA